MGSFELLREVDTRHRPQEDLEALEWLRRSEVPRLAGPMGRTGPSDMLPPPSRPQRVGPVPVRMPDLEELDQDEADLWESFW